MSVYYIIQSYWKPDIVHLFMNGPLWIIINEFQGKQQSWDRNSKTKEEKIYRPTGFEPLSLGTKASVLPIGYADPKGTPIHPLKIYRRSIYVKKFKPNYQAWYAMMSQYN